MDVPCSRKSIEEVIDFLRGIHPDTPIVFRADSGFIRESLVRGIVEKGAYYLFGYAPNRAIQKFADTEWAPEVIKQYDRPGRRHACAARLWESTRSIGRRSGRLTHTRTFV